MISNVTFFMGMLQAAWSINVESQLNLNPVASGWMKMMQFAHCIGKGPGNEMFADQDTYETGSSETDLSDHRSQDDVRAHDDLDNNAVSVGTKSYHIFSTFHENQIQYILISFR